MARMLATLDIALRAAAIALLALIAVVVLRDFGCKVAAQLAAALAAGRRSLQSVRHLDFPSSSARKPALPAHR